MARNPARYRYLPFGGLLPRPGPEGLPVLLGAFSRCANMGFLLKNPRFRYGWRTARGVPR